MDVDVGRIETIAASLLAAALDWGFVYISPWVSRGFVGVVIISAAAAAAAPPAAVPGARRATSAASTSICNGAMSAFAAPLAVAGSDDCVGAALFDRSSAGATGATAGADDFGFFVSSNTGCGVGFGGDGGLIKLSCLSLSAEGGLLTA